MNYIKQACVSLLCIAFFLLASCADETPPVLLKPAQATLLLHGENFKVWQLATSNSATLPCEMDNDLILIPNDNFSFVESGEKCNENQPDILFEGKFKVIYSRLKNLNQLVFIKNKDSIRWDIMYLSPKLLEVNYNILDYPVKETYTAVE